MAQTQLEERWEKRLRIRELADISNPTILTDRLDSRLYFSLETRSFVTPFRKLVLNYIYRIVLESAEDTLESAGVSLSVVPDEEDSLHLTLTLTVLSDWQTVQGLRHEVLSKVSIWSKEWTEEEQRDYGRWIYVRLLPAGL